MPDGMTVTVIVTKLQLDKMIPALPKQVADAVDTTCENIRDLAAMQAPVASGALASSLYVATPNVDDYSSQSAEAAGLNPRALIESEVTPDSVLSLYGTGSDSKYTGVVGAAVNYALYQELGTRFMGAHPFLVPSAEINRDAFTSAVTDAINSAAS